MCIFYAHMESIFVDLWMDTFQTNIVEYLQEDRDLQKETDVKEKKNQNISFTHNAQLEKREGNSSFKV